MDWTLQQIRLENFKFFKKPFDFQTYGKNVLLYGENGSGKSSIYWSFYSNFWIFNNEETYNKSVKQLRGGIENGKNF